MIDPTGDAIPMCCVSLVNIVIMSLPRMSNLFLSTHRNSIHVSSWALVTLRFQRLQLFFQVIHALRNFFASNVSRSCPRLIRHLNRCHSSRDTSYQTPLPLAEQIFTKHPQLFLHVVRSFVQSLSKFRRFSLWVTVCAQVHALHPLSP